MIYGSHPISRLALAIATILVLLAGNKLLSLVTAAALIVWLDGGWLNLRRAASALKWFIIPIILLHVLFTGGQRIWPESGIPLSLDGLRAGVDLSLMLVSYYLVAMLISRLWRQQEVLAMTARFPWMGNKMFPFLVSLVAVRRTVRIQLEQFRQQFLLRRQGWQVGLLSTSILRSMFVQSTTCARAVWLRWPVNVPASGGRSDWVNDLLVLTITSVLLAAGYFI